MFKKSLALTLSLIFTFATVFPANLFAYESLDYKSADTIKKDNWVDESAGVDSIAYKKVRCPRCGMEFYYTPDKEGPHSHWVHYEVSESKDIFDEENAEDTSGKISDGKDEDNTFFNIFGSKKETQDKLKGMAESRNKTSMSERMTVSQAMRLGSKNYELRQQLTCPYDGHTFFPDGNIIEDLKIMKEEIVVEKPSSIEQSFSKAVPFGVSKELKQFGYDLFAIPEEERQEKKQKASEAFTGSEDFTAMALLQASMISKSETPTLTSDMPSTDVIPIGPDYIIGPGDTLLINIWGSVQETSQLDVDREGRIMLPKAGPLYVWGLKFEEVEQKIKERLDRYFTNINVDISMGKLRDINVYIMGEVEKPGAYSISSQSNIFQALYKAGGPTKLGSLRKIKVISRDGKEKKIDLYPFLLEGAKVEESRVNSGDTIFVPPIGNVIAAAGNVKRPGIYETKNGITLEELLNFAGGATPTGDMERVQVERIVNNERRVMVDIELKKDKLGKFSMEGVPLQNGDIVMVSPIVRLKHDFVSVIGNVERPGDYALSKEMKVMDLIDRAKGYLPGTYLYRAEIARVTEDRTREIIPVNLDSVMLGEGKDLYLNEWDILIVYSEPEVRPPSYVEVDGAVNRPGKYEMTPKMKISDLVFRAGGLKIDEVVRGAELFHIMPGEQPVVRKIGLKAVSDTEILVDKDIILRAGDALFVQSEPRLTERKVVVIKGEVRYPGTYSIREGEKMSSLIERAGGFTKEAFLDGAVFTRKSIRDAQEKMRERFVERENRSLLEEQQSLLLRRGSGIDSSSVSEGVKMRREMLRYIASADIEGRMVINLKPINELKTSKYDILLEDGDMLKIPQTPSAITIMGSVNNPTSVPYEARKGVQYYIRKVGGMTKHADKAGMYVIRANGEAVNKFMMSKRIHRGDTIVIPQTFKYWTPPGQLLRDTVEILSRIAVGVGIIAALD